MKFYQTNYENNSRHFFHGFRSFGYHSNQWACARFRGQCNNNRLVRGLNTHKASKLIYFSETGRLLKCGAQSISRRGKCPFTTLSKIYGCRTWAKCTSWRRCWRNIKASNHIIKKLKSKKRFCPQTFEMWHVLTAH